MGFDEALHAAGLSERTRVLTCAMVMNRLIPPTSEPAMPRWMRRTALGELLGTDIDALSESALYRNMDRLHPPRALIESDLVERELFNLDQSIFFHDPTTSWNQERVVPGRLLPGFFARRTGAVGRCWLYRNRMANCHRVLSHLYLADEQTHDTLPLGKRHRLRAFAHALKEPFNRRGKGKLRGAIELGGLQGFKLSRDGTLSSVHGSHSFA